MTGLQGLLEEADLALGRLDGMTALLPNPALFLYMYVRKEAVLSSQIEGTQSSLADLLLHEHENAPGVPLDDVREVSCYVAALEHGIARLAEIPLSLRLIREIHGILLSHGRGAGKLPGEFRASQNWIGGTRPGNAAFVPPPPQDVMGCMGDLEKFLHDDAGRKLPVLIRAGLAHVQFETIHPFLDGNGRAGRLLITLMLREAGLLSQPLLYVSLYFKQHRADYYRLLNEVRERGAWEAWLEFFLTAARDAAIAARETILNIQSLFAHDRKTIATLGRARASALRIHDYMTTNPLATVEQIQEGTNLGYATVSRVMPRLADLGIVRETTGHARNRIFAYDAYMKILEQGTEPL
jgi:Fic family protein